MKVEMRSVHDIKPYGNNPRHNEHAVAAVAASIHAFGFRQPIVIDEDGVIVVGDTRYKAACKLGLETIPVHVATGLSADKADTKTDRRKKSGDPRPRNLKHLQDQWRRFNKARKQCDTDKQAALEITNDNARAAETLLRQFRRY